MNRQSAIATLAEAFGTCAASCERPTRIEDPRLPKLRKIARVLDRLASDGPERSTWPAHARRLYGEMNRMTTLPTRSMKSLWASTG